MDDLGVPPIQETTIYPDLSRYIYINCSAPTASLVAEVRAQYEDTATRKKDPKLLPEKYCVTILFTS